MSKSLSNMSKQGETKENLNASSRPENCNFLTDITSPQEGINKLIDTCKQFPEGKQIV